MKSEEAEAIAQQIWDAIPRDGAYVWLVGDDAVDDESLGHSYRVEGNRDGLLRLAAEILQAVGSGDSASGYLFHSKPALTRMTCTLTTEPPRFEATPQLPLWKKRLMQGGCLTVLIFAALCMAIGLYTILRSFF